MVRFQKVLMGDIVIFGTATPRGEGSLRERERLAVKLRLIEEGINSGHFYCNVVRRPGFREFIFSCSLSSGEEALEIIFGTDELHAQSD